MPQFLQVLALPSDPGDFASRLDNHQAFQRPTPMCSSWTFAAACLPAWHWARNTVLAKTGARNALLLGAKNELGHYADCPCSPRYSTTARIAATCSGKVKSIPESRRLLWL